MNRRRLLPLLGLAAALWLGAGASGLAQPDKPLHRGVINEAAAPSPDGGDQDAADGGTVEGALDWMDAVDSYFGTYLVKPFALVLFRDIGAKPLLGTEVPFVVGWLLFGALFLTLRMSFINLRGFWHAIRVTAGRYDNPADAGEVTHFQALASALSATVGLGNIAGVAIAVGTGGPGAVFWLILAGLLGMTSKFTECTLGQMYRRVDEDNVVSGGPMRYLREGLEDIGLKWLGVPLALLFAVLCIGGSFGGGCAFQVSQSMDIVKSELEWLDGREWVYGLVMALMTGLVILGGIKRIAATAEKIVPLMCGVYLAASLTILGMHAQEIPAAFGTIFREAFRWESAYGGFLGVMVIGVKRAVFSNEAGVGSAAIAHSAARTDHPVREGIVALLEPFIDTVVICTMTGLVIVVTGAYDTQQFPEHAALIKADQGATLTANAYRTEIEWFPKVLAVAAWLFAYSTMISWSYYGERCATFLFGRGASVPYKLLFLVFVFLGSVVTATNVKDFSDLMILSMSLPNLLGLLLLSGKVRLKLDDYWQAYKMGDFEPDARPRRGG